MENESLDGYLTPATEWPGSGIAAPQTTQWTPQKIASKRANIIELILQQAALALQGFLSNGSGFAQLVAWADDLREQLEGVPILGDLIEALTGIEDGDLNDLGTYFLNIRNFLGGINFLDPSFNPAVAAKKFYDVVIQPILDAFFWWVPGWRQAPTSLGNVTSELPNMVFDAPFGSAPGESTGTWYYRGDVGHTKLGSAWLNAADAPDELIASPIQVAKGQKFEPSVWVAWTGATATGAALELRVAEYTPFTGTGVPVQKGSKVVASATPLGSEPFHEITGEYEVPEGVGMVGLSVRVTSQFTGGILGIDDLSGPAVGKLALDWTEMAREAITNFNIMMGLTDEDHNGVIDIVDRWVRLQSELPPLPELKITADTKVGEFLIGTANALGIPDGDLDGDIDFHDFWLAWQEHPLLPPLPELKITADTKVGEFLIDTAAIFGIEDADFDGDIDVHDVWLKMQQNPLLPPFPDLKLDEAGTTVFHFLSELGRSLGLPPLTGAEGESGETLKAAAQLSQLAQSASAAATDAQNQLADAQNGVDDGIEIVDTNKFYGTDGQPLNTPQTGGTAMTDWKNTTTYGGSADLTIRVVNGLPMMGIAPYTTAGSTRGDTHNTTGTVPGGLHTRRYYSTQWYDKFKDAAAASPATPGYTQFAEMVLGGGGVNGFPSTFLITHATDTLTNGLYLEAHAGGLRLGTFTQSSGVYSNVSPSPVKDISMPLSVGMRVGVYNLAPLPHRFVITVNGKVVDHWDDTPTYKVSLDDSHVYAGVLLSRAWFTYNSGLPWQTQDWVDSFYPAQVLFADYELPPVAGVVGMRHRSVAAAASTTASSSMTRWSGVVNAIDRLGGGMLQSGEGFQVPVAGPYMWHIRATMDNTQGAVDFWNVGVFLNSDTTPASVGHGNSEILGFGGSETNVTTGASGIVYCNAGDIVKPAGAIGPGGFGYIGSTTDDTVTFFNLAKIG